MLLCRINHSLIFNITSEVNYCIAIVFKQNLYNILAYIMNISLYGCKNYFSLAYGSRIAADHLFSDNFKCCLSNSCRENKLRQKYFTLFKLYSCLVKSRNKHIINNIHSIMSFKQLFSNCCTVIFKTIFYSIENINIFLVGRRCRLYRL